MLYLSTLSPGFSFGDSGELLAGAATLGIAHPPGYPLFLLAGRLFLALPIPGSIAWRLNLFTALCGAFAVLLLCILLRRVLERLGLREPVADLSALAGALLLAFSRAWWSECVATEVYTFQILLVVGWLLVLESEMYRAVWFLAGLSIIAHPASAVLAPVCAWMCLKLRRPSPRRILGHVSLFALGLSPALYIYLRGTGNPWQDWGGIRSFHEAFDHLTRQRYGGLVLHRYLALGWMMKRYLHSLLTQWTPAGVPLVLIGFVALRRRSRALSDLWLAMFALTGPLAVILVTGLLAPSQRVDFEPFCMLSYVMLAGLMSVGVAWMLARHAPAGLASTMLVLGFVCVVNGPKVSQAGNTIPEGYAHLLIGSIPEDAVVIPLKDATSYVLDYEGAIRRLPVSVSVYRYVPRSGRRLRDEIESMLKTGRPVLTDLVPDTWPLHERSRPAGLLLEVCEKPIREFELDRIKEPAAALESLRERAFQRSTRQPGNLGARLISTHFVDFGLLLKQRHQDKEAGRMFDMAIRWNPRNVDAHIQAARLALDQDRLEAARTHVSLAMETEPFSAAVHLLRGRLRLVDRDVEGAVADWEQARMMDPDDLFSRLLLAKVYLQMGDWAAAREVLTEALQIEPDNIEARRLLAEASRSGES